MFIYQKNQFICELNHNLSCKKGKNTIECENFKTMIYYV